MSKFLQSRLIPGERLITETGTHWRVYLPALPVIGIFGFLAKLCLVMQSDDAALVFAALGVVTFLSVWPDRAWGVFAVTDKRLIIKPGPGRRKMIITSLANIEDMEVSQSLLGRLAGYGTLKVSVGRYLGYGSMKVIDIGCIVYIYKNVARPRSLREAWLDSRKEP